MASAIDEPGVWPGDDPILALDGLVRVLGHRRPARAVLGHELLCGLHRIVRQHADDGKVVRPVLLELPEELRNSSLQGMHDARN